MVNYYINLINKIKKTFFPFYKNKEIKNIFKILNKNNFTGADSAMFVGGCVRKHLLGEEIDDIDIATNLTPNQVKEKFKDTKFKVVDTGIDHGTVTIVSNKLKFEITTLRKDIKTDGRHAEIEYTNDWQKDSERRDFTVNAIYLNINGKIFDPQLGEGDLNNREIRFIGDPQKRIEEDYLRIIRFIRFSLEYNSDPEENVIKTIKLNLDGIKKISKERIFKELLKILDGKNFLKINEKISLKEIFLLIFPELQNINRLNKIGKISNNLTLNREMLLSILLLDDSNNVEYFSHKYNVSNDLKNKLNLININFKKFNNDKDFFKKDLQKNIYLFGKDHLIILNIIRFIINQKDKIHDYYAILNLIKKFEVPNFPFSGKYLKDKGMKEGVKIGKILKLIEKEWIKNDFNISNDDVEKIINSNNQTY